MTLNNGSVVAIQTLLEHLDRKALQVKDLTWVDDDSYLFAGKDPSKPLTVPYLNNVESAPEPCPARFVVHQSRHIL